MTIFGRYMKYGLHSTDHIWACLAGEALPSPAPTSPACPLPFAHSNRPQIWRQLLSATHSRGLRCHFCRCVVDCQAGLLCARGDTRFRRAGVTRCCYGCCQTENLGYEENAPTEKRAVEKTSLGRVKKSAERLGISLAFSASPQSPAIRNARPPGATPLR